jgi:hypothetical protein
MKAKKVKSENWRVVLRKIERSGVISPDRKKTAQNALERYAQGYLSEISFKHSATKLGDMFHWAKSEQGFFFWANINDDLKRGGI